ncbi:Myb DNA-bind 3 domain-containing protein [Abeliophyllum distichum]|uniref:Myb DNA-bind 3 domain-containing protein n=1 Tax=Abeliophyllum distichum TaxID=126358 RepID=A0ABD1PQR8_9LAMI
MADRDEGGATVVGVGTGVGGGRAVAELLLGDAGNIQLTVSQSSSLQASSLQLFPIGVRELTTFVFRGRIIIDLDMSTSTFDASGSGKGNKTKQPKPTRTSAQWDPEAKRVFISLCEEEIIAGRRPGSHFTPEGWKNIVEGFYSITGHQYSKAQFKNQWDTMKA